MRKTFVALLTGVVALMGAGCSGGTPRAGRSPTAPVAEGLEALPARTLSDWRVHAAYVAVVSVTGERAIPLPQGDSEEEDGWLYVGRTADLRIRRVLWKSALVPASPSKLTIKTTGWFTRSGERVPANVQSGARMSVGGTYLVALVHFPHGWGLQTSNSAFPVDHDVVRPTDSPISAQIAGKTVDEVATKITG